MEAAETHDDAASGPPRAGRWRRLAGVAFTVIPLLPLSPLTTMGAADGPLQDVALSPAQQDWVRPLLAAHRAASDPDGALWPGYSPLFMPVLLHFEEAAGAGRGLSVLLGHPSPPEGFRPLPSGRPELSGASIAIKPDDQVTLKAVFGKLVLDGKPTFVWRVPAGQTASSGLPTLVHENFHFFQDSWTGIGVAPRPGQPLRGAPSPEAQADATIEQLLLGRAVMEEAEFSRTAREFSTLRSVRHAAGRHENARWEARQEAIEGMAALVEYRFVDEHLAPGARQGGLLRDRVFARLMEGLNQAETEAKWRYYGSGSAQGLLLDRAGARWRGQVAAGTPLFEIFRRKFPPLPDSAAVVGALRRRFHRPALVAMARARDVEEASNRQLLRDMFSRFEGLKLVLRAGRLGSTGSSEGASMIFEDGSSAEAGASDETPWDGAISLRLSRAAKMVRPGPPATVEVLLGPAQATRVSVDGKDTGGQGPLPFHELEIRSPHAHLRLARPGTLRRRGGLLIVEVPSLERDH